MRRDRCRSGGRGGFVVLAALGASLSGVPAATAAPPDAMQVETLMRALHAAPDEQAARQLEGQLRDMWRAAGSPSGVMLLNRSLREIQSSSPEAAIDDADAVLVLDPEFAEAFAVRATAKLLAGNTVAALRDAAEALKREPRHIGALMVLSRAAEQGGNFKAAYEAWQKLIELDPKTPDGQSRLNELKRKAVGEDI